MSTDEIKEPVARGEWPMVAVCRMDVRDDLLSDNRQWTNADILGARALAESRGYARGVEASARVASSFASIVHGHLPVNPQECAEQVAREIASGIRALTKGA